MNGGQSPGGQDQEQGQEHPPGHLVVALEPTAPKERQGGLHCFAVLARPPLRPDQAVQLCGG
eukprot:8186747-Lingulodinium_polyedra.AAC.1